MNVKIQHVGGILGTVYIEIHAWLISSTFEYNLNFDTGALKKTYVLLNTMTHNLLKIRPSLLFYIGIQNCILSAPLQEEFVKLVKIKEENKEEVKYKCWAGWASEEKMRDVLKLKELGSYIFLHQ